MKHGSIALILIFVSFFSGILGAWSFFFLSGQFELNTHTPQQEENVARESSQVSLVSLKDTEKNITGLVDTISPAVVSIVIKKDLIVYRSDPWWFFEQPTGTVRRQVGGGSGFFVRKDGTILTNKHVVADPQAIYTVILSDGTEYDAQVLALDPINDLAVIQIQSEKNDFPVLPLISQNEDIKVGSFVVAVWNALAEFQNSVSLWIISGKERTIEAQGEELSGLIQTDAAINPGNSGGPLIELSGKVVWINTAIVSWSNGIGFSIALTQEKIEYMLKSIQESWKIKRPFIGINYIENSPWVAKELKLSENYWVYIVEENESVIPGSEAQKAGLEWGDLILSINGKKIQGSETLISIIQNSIPGTMIELEVIKKGGEKKTLQMKLGEY